jgi:FkbM family methyltransferase
MKYFYDVGANVGNTDFYLKKNRARYAGYHIVCFEPSPRHISALRQRISELGSVFGGVTIVPAALSNRDGEQELYEKVGSSQGDSLDPGHLTTLQTSYRLLVPTIRVSRFVLEHTEATDRITLKLDVEGSEYSILNELLSQNGAEALKRVEAVLVEWHACFGYDPKICGHSLSAQLLGAGISVEEWTQ